MNERSMKKYYENKYKFNNGWSLKYMNELKIKI